MKFYTFSIVYFLFTNLASNGQKTKLINATLTSHGAHLLFSEVQCGSKQKMAF